MVEVDWSRGWISVLAGVGRANKKELGEEAEKFEQAAYGCTLRSGVVLCPIVPSGGSWDWLLVLTFMSAKL